MNEDEHSSKKTLETAPTGIWAELPDSMETVHNTKNTTDTAPNWAQASNKETDYFIKLNEALSKLNEALAKIQKLEAELAFYREASHTEGNANNPSQPEKEDGDCVNMEIAWLLPTRKPQKRK